MKPAQWTTVLILALMVGGISFISVYLGSNNREQRALPAETSSSLSFPVKIFPQEGEKMQATEVGQRGHQDFWFANETGQDVPVGLNKKGCTCSEVEITVAPAYWQTSVMSSAVTQALEQPPRSLANLTTLAAAWDRERLYPEMPDGAETSKMLTVENSLVVPAGAIGRVRLSWRQTHARPLNTYADLWIGQRGGTVNAKLEVKVLIAPPLEVTKELTVPTISESDLDKNAEGQRAWIVCYSLTRPSFDIKAEMLHERVKPESDPVEVGEPIPLKSEELPRLQNQAEEAMLVPLSGYRIPVTVRARSKDGTPIEWGHFRRLVRVSSSDETIEPVQIKVTGEVRGEISLRGSKEGGMIDLGPFPQSRGAHGSIILQSEDQEVDLKLDAARQPEYLNAVLSKPEDTGAGVRQWKLRVEVPPKAAYGEFPRADDPVYRDSAIYVTTTKGKMRSIRIPVLGVANNN